VTVQLALVAAGCSSSSAPEKTPVNGGTAVMAEPPAEAPSYIFPFMDGPDVSNQNLFDFTYLMYRPLYWFGQGLSRWPTRRSAWPARPSSAAGT
jgi:hypothetical protein